MQLWHTFNYFQTRIHKWIFSTSTIRGQYVFGWIGLFLLVLFFSRHKVTKTILFLTNRRNNNEYDRDFLRYFCRRTTRIYRCRPTLSVHLDWCHYRSNCKSNISSRDKIISILILFAGTLFAGGVFEGLGQSFSTKGIIFGLLAAVSFHSMFCKRARRYGCSALYEKLPYDNKRYSYRMPILSANLFNRRCFASRSMEICFLPRIIRRCCTCHLFSIGVPKVGTGLGTILGAAELPTAIIASITLVHEVVTFMQWIGIIFILVGIFTPQLLTARKERKQNRVHSA